MLRRTQKLIRHLRGLDLAGFESSPDQVEARNVLARKFLKHEGRSIHKWMHYFDAYDEEFSRYRDGFPLADGTTRPLRFLEIGVQHGGSLELWRDYFGPPAQLWGIDVDPRCADADTGDLHVRIGSQADPVFLHDVVAEMGGVDIVLDDGSHYAGHQRASLHALFPLLADGGTYACEDAHTAYWRDFDGGYQRAGSYLEISKQLVDDLNGHYHHRGDRTGLNATYWVPRVAFYDSMVFIRKERRARPINVRVGQPSW